MMNQSQVMSLSSDMMFRTILVVVIEECCSSMGNVRDVDWERLRFQVR